MKKKAKSTGNNNYFWLLFFAVTSILYLHNLTHDIFGGDVGDLVTSAITHGIAHPPGYPLFMIMGFVFSHFPLPLLPVSKIGLISVLSSLLALFFFQRTIALLVKNVYFQVLSVSILAFSYLFWLYAEIPEVFSLNAFLSISCIYFSLKFYYDQKFRYLFLSILFYGFGLTNHMTIILTIPIFIMVVFLKRKEIFKFKKKLAFLPLAFFLGLLPYIYLPIASLSNPLIEWNKIDSWSSFFHHVLRRDYGTFSAGAFNQPDPEAKLVILKTYFLTVVRSITIPVSLISVLGFLYSLKKEKKLGIGLLLTFLFTGPFFIAYSGFPIADLFVLGISERFYLLSQIVILLFLPWGFEAISIFFNNILSKKIYPKIILAIFVLIPVLMLKVNFQKTNFSTTSMGTDFAKDYFRNLPGNSLLFLTGDTRSFNAWYTYYILGFRRDVNIVQIGSFGIKNKYFDNIESTIRKETGLDGNQLFINSLLKASEQKEIYSMIEIPVPDSYKWLQLGLNKKLFKKEKLPNKDEYTKLVVRNLKDIKIPYEQNLKPSERSLILRSLLTYYSGAVNNIGSTYLSEYNDKKASDLYYNMAILIDPNYSESYKNLSILYTLENKCDEAEENIKKAIKLYPIEVKYYLTWNEIAKQCFKSQEKINSVNEAFYNSFNFSLEQAISKKDKNDKK